MYHQLIQNVSFHNEKLMYHQLIYKVLFRNKKKLTFQYPNYIYIYDYFIQNE